MKNSGHLVRFVKAPKYRIARGGLGCSNGDAGGQENEGHHGSDPNVNVHHQNLDSMYACMQPLF